MTNKQAAEVIEMTLNEIASQIPGAGMLDNDTAEGLRQTITAFNMAHAALRGPVPDPETGLAPCGCGGKAEPIQAVYGFRVVCKNCFNATDNYFHQDNADKAWNTAHGYREEEE